MSDSANASPVDTPSKLLREQRAIERGEINNRREIFGWVMYDWANSAFSTTVATTLLGPYLTALAQNALHDENGTVFSFGWFGTVTAKSFFPFCVAISVFLQTFFLPVLGA